MIYYIREKRYSQFPWCSDTVRSICEAARRRKIPVTEIECLDDIPTTDNKAFLLIVAAGIFNLENIVTEAKNRGIIPISLANGGTEYLSDSCSSVSMDLKKSTGEVLDYLKSVGKNNTALYGVNDRSSSDFIKEQVFVQRGGSKDHIFRLEDDFNMTFERFCGSIETFDSVLCVNGFAAISLISHLKDKGVRVPEDLYVAAFGNISLLEKNDPPITSVIDNFEEFGDAAFVIINTLMHRDYLSVVHLKLEGALIIRESTANQACNIQELSNQERINPENMFFSDRDVWNVLKAEQLFNSCDSVDLQVLKELAGGATYADIAEKCFLSESTIKYRIRKMKEICDADSRKDLVSFIRNYI